MGKVGSVVEATGKILGTIAKYDIKLTGEVASIAANVVKRKDIGDKIRNISYKTGDFVGDSSNVLAEVSGKLADMAVEKGDDFLRILSRNVVKETVTEINEKGEISEKTVINNIKYKVEE